MLKIQHDAVGLTVFDTKNKFTANACKIKCTYTSFLLNELQRKTINDKTKNKKPMPPNAYTKLQMHHPQTLVGNYFSDMLDDLDEQEIF